MSRQLTPLQRFSEHLSELGRWPRLGLMISHDVFAMLLSLWLAFSVRLGVLYSTSDARVWAVLAGAVAFGIAGLILLRAYSMVVRFIDNRAASRLAAGAAIAAMGWFAVAFLSGLQGIPRSVGLIYFPILFLILYFSRVAVALFLNFAQHRPSLLRLARPTRVNAAIYGCNEATVGLFEALRSQPRYALQAIIADEESLVGRVMMGVRIRSGDELPRLAASGEVRHIFLALPNLNRSERLALVSRLSSYGIEVMTLPTYDEIVSGRYTFSDVRPLNVDDLLARQTVPPMAGLIEGVRGKAVLVTGAGGSIGSEICRQAVASGAGKLVMLDHSEFALYQIEAELRGSNNVVREVYSVIGSLLNQSLLQHLFATHHIDTVFHAAAYKHVPLLEINQIVGVENNVLGTQNLADACLAARVPRMTMISTDKAVRPTSVMGASKRVAELYIQALSALPQSSTVFGIVRFGNVLDSSGSVVQKFREQILAGGPVTVTDPEITRFFMSIPEATQLVLQASEMAGGGEVFVLDMGEPIRIAELAKTMIALYGLTERNAENLQGDITVEYVGLRPGEKLHEELFVGSEVFDTVHPRIKMAHERCVELPTMLAHIARLKTLMSFANPGKLQAFLFEILADDELIQIEDDDFASVGVN